MYFKKEWPLPEEENATQKKLREDIETKMSTVIDSVVGKTGAELCGVMYKKSSAPIKLWFVFSLGLYDSRDKKTFVNKMKLKAPEYSRAGYLFSEDKDFIKRYRSRMREETVYEHDNFQAIII